MTTIDDTRSAPARPRPAPPRIALSQRTRRTALVVHILAAGIWVGIDVLVAVLVTVGRLAGDDRTRGLAYQALGTFVVMPMLVAGLLCLVSGIILGLGTKWGLTRYWWVLAKLVMNVTLCVLIVIALRPGMPEVVDAGEAIAAGGTTDTDLSSLFFPPIVSLSLLSLATWLSVFKPWGRRRQRGRA